MRSECPACGSPLAFNGFIGTSTQLLYCCSTPLSAPPAPASSLAPLVMSERCQYVVLP